MSEENAPKRIHSSTPLRVYRDRVASETRPPPLTRANVLQRIAVADLGLEAGTGHEVGLYPVVYLDGTLGTLVRTLGGRLGGLRRVSAVATTTPDDGAHQLVRAAVDHLLTVVYDGPDEPVCFGHEPELEEYGHVVPVHDPGADLVPAERADEPAVPDAVGDGEYETAAAPELSPYAGAQQELDAGQVDLAQVPGVVHVSQVHVQVGSQAHGRVDGRVGGPELLLEARGRHVAEQRPEKVRQVQQAHGYQNQRQSRASRRQCDHRRRRSRAGGSGGGGGRGRRNDRSRRRGRLQQRRHHRPSRVLALFPSYARRYLVYRLLWSC